MLAELILVTRLLGLVSGEHPITVQVDSTVRAVDVVVDGKTLTTLREAPWRTVLNFGAELAPHELTAIAYDANGAEVGRDTQLVNLARPPAEAIIGLERAGGKLRATVRWQHIAAATPEKIELKLDGKTIATGEASVALPAVEPTAVHVLQAEVLFPGGTTASKELVFGGQYSEQVPSELTAVLAHGTSDCFQLGGATVRAAAVEKPDAFVHFVRGSDADLGRRRLRMPGAGSRETGQLMHTPFRLENTQMCYIWPTSREIHTDDTEAVTNLFWRSEVVSGKWGTQRMLSLYPGPATKSQRFADAVAVAGVQALAGAKRRAVVLVLTGERDDSRHSAGVVRRYLQRIGVPLIVWSIVGDDPKGAAEWGAVTNISNADRLRRATEKLREELESQRIAWLPIAPLDTRRVKPCS